MAMQLYFIWNKLKSSASKGFATSYSIASWPRDFKAIVDRSTVAAVII
jgi:hypothetical protein